MKQKKQTILEWYRENQRYMDAPCGGLGKCGKCKVLFKEEAPQATERERSLLTEEEINRNIRLACETEMTKAEAFSLIGEIFTSAKEESLNEENATYGIAIDIGTTTLVMQLVSLCSGTTVATLSMINPQRVYGADVMSRIKAANEGALLELQSLVKEALLTMYKQLTEKHNMRESSVKKIVIVGNTTMLHILRGLSCKSLGEAPFLPVDNSLQEYEVSSPQKEVAKDAKVYILPGISAFVGADVTAGIYACDMDLSKEVQMLVDVGTNGEMVIGNREGFFVTSTAAGPVFEGGNISCGMAAVNGGIKHLELKNGMWHYQSVGDSKPCGICGTGIIDLVALLWKQGVIDENGTLTEAFFETGYPLKLSYAEEEIQFTISQSDIREFQMGKGAIRAGMEILLKNDKPEKIYLAGAFGRALVIANSVDIGLFPKEIEDRLQPIGNTALNGAKRFLMDENGAERVRRIASLSRERLLAEEPDFFDSYIQYMQFEK